MFFHNITKIHRKEDVTEILDTIFSENKDIIIPLVSPNTIFGKFLLEDKNTEFLSEYSGDNINIVYLAKNNIDKYALFIRKIISLIEEYSSKKLEEPSIIVFNKERKNVYIFNEFSDINTKSEFKKFNIQILDALRSNNPNMNLTMLKFKNEITNDRVTAFLSTIFKIFNDVFL